MGGSLFLLTFQQNYVMLFLCNEIFEHIFSKLKQVLHNNLYVKSATGGAILIQNAGVLQMLYGMVAFENTTNSS